MIEQELTRREHDIDNIVNKVEAKAITKVEGIQKLCHIRRGLKAYVKNFSFPKDQPYYKKMLLKQVKRTTNRILYCCKSWETNNE